MDAQALTWRQVQTPLGVGPGPKAETRDAGPRNTSSLHTTPGRTGVHSIGAPQAFPIGGWPALRPGARSWDGEAKDHAQPGG